MILRSTLYAGLLGLAGLAACYNGAQDYVVCGSRTGIPLELETEAMVMRGNPREEGFDYQLGSESAIPAYATRLGCDIVVPATAEQALFADLRFRGPDFGKMDRLFNSETEHSDRSLFRADGQVREGSQ